MCLITRTEASHNIQVASCRCTGNICCEDFPNSQRYQEVESILSKVEVFPAFLKMNSTSDIYCGFSKIFRATTSRGRFCLTISQETTVYWCDWFCFPVRLIWHSKELFSLKFLVRCGTRTHCTFCLKKDTIPLYA